MGHKKAFGNHTTFQDSGQERFLNVPFSKWLPFLRSWTSAKCRIGGFKMLEKEHKFRAINSLIMEKLGVVTILFYFQTYIHRKSQGRVLLSATNDLLEIDNKYWRGQHQPFFAQGFLRATSKLFLKPHLDLPFWQVDYLNLVAFLFFQSL